MLPIVYGRTPRDIAIKNLALTEPFFKEGIVKKIWAQVKKSIDKARSISYI